MTEKLSQIKISKMISLYLQGHSETDIANKLKIDQSTVSKYKTKFKALAKEQGIKNTGKEYNDADNLEALHCLGAELMKNKLTAEEAKAGLKMELFFQKYGVKQEEYGDLIQACKKMNDEGFITAAIELKQLENSTGMTYKEIVAQATAKYKQLQENQKDLETVTGKLTASKEELANIDKQKKVATHGLETHMQKIGVDMHRLKLVEGLASTLKDAGAPDKEIDDYIQRQKVLNKAGISIGMFVSIVDKAKVINSQDNGKELFQMLSEYGNLSETCKSLHYKLQLLEKQSQGLEQKSKIKGELEVEIGKLTAEKVSLQPHVAELHKQKNTLDKVQGEVSSLTNKKEELKHEIAELEAHRDALGGDIKVGEQEVSGLKDLKMKYDALQHDTAEMEDKVNHDKKRWQVFEGFLGLVQSSSLAELQKSARTLPKVVEQAQEGEYSTDFLKGSILQDLAGPTFQVMKCSSCGTRFYIDKPAPVGGYQCPMGGFGHLVAVDKDALAILKAALSAPKKQDLIVVQKIIPIPKPPKSKDSTNG